MVDTVEFDGTPEIAKGGIVPGDWFVVYGISPGLKVNVACEWMMIASVLANVMESK